ncbi:hypothetical protein GS682_14775 [Nostoc sp. B(2019)]|nr:hypothetical protein [Nostoc sp. B(2019)]
MGKFSIGSVNHTLLLGINLIRDSLSNLLVWLTPESSPAPRHFQASLLSKHTLPVALNFMRSPKTLIQ